MTIDEAIKLLASLSEGWPISNSEDYDKAIQLGIEALKAYKYFRMQGLQGIMPNLPGETP